ncbi:MAG: hypothetical protein HOE79_04995 [Euryarchaeota archaeon]|nr:hypothetical protein [Euryarchaeota archaeon]
MRSLTICVTISLLLLVSSLSAIVMGGSNDYPIESENGDVLLDFGTYYSSENNTTLGWFSQASGLNNDMIEDSVSFQNGTTTVVGSFQSYIDFSFDFPGPQATGGIGDIDFYIAWLDVNGSWQSSIGGGSQGFDTIDSIEKLPSGDIVVSGTYCYNTVGEACNLVLGELDPLNKTNDDDSGNVFIASLSSDGVWLWANQIESPLEVHEFSLTVNNQNEIHLGAIYTGMLEIDGQIIPGSDQPGILITIFNESGEIVNAINAISPQGIESIGSLCVDGLGNTYAAITFFEEITFDQIMLNGTGYADIAIARYDSTGWLWAQSGGGTSEDLAWGCGGSQSGVVVVGEYQGNASFGSYSTESSQWIDGFIVSLNEEGSWQSLQIISGIGSDRVTEVLVNQFGDMTIAGITSGGFTIGQDVLQDIDGNTDVYHYDVFVAHADVNETWQWAIIAGGQGDDSIRSMNVGPYGSPIVTVLLHEDGVFGGYEAYQENEIDIGVWSYETDLDGDGIVDGSDNCLRDSNPLQENYDDDDFGDVCDLDDDGDGVEDLADDCPYGETQWQSDSSTDYDSDGCKDSTEDYDDDEDGVFDTNDLCPLGPLGWVSNPEEDIEGDGCADWDTDEDGFVDQMDNCPGIYNPLQADLDDDQIGDICDDDEDGDGISIPQDNCPHDLDPWISDIQNDHDSDGCRDSINDYDDDDDAILDVNDGCPIGHVGWADNSSTFDHDGDGCHDQLEDDDDDNDGFDDDADNCPNGIVGISQPGQDEDGDGCVDSVEDEDDDDDGIIDSLDQCPRTPKLTMVSGSGCSQYQLDDDLDGVVNAEDICLNSKPSVAVDEQGCEKLVIIQNPAESVDEDSLFNLTNFFFLLAILMGVVALYISNMKPKMSKISVPPVNPMEALESPSNVKTLEPASIEALRSAEEDAIEEDAIEEDVTEEDAAEPEAVSDEIDYSSMTVVQLKELLREAGKTVSGKKAELIERLQE